MSVLIHQEARRQDGAANQQTDCALTDAVASRYTTTRRHDASFKGLTKHTDITDRVNGSRDAGYAGVARAIRGGDAK